MFKKHFSKSIMYKMIKRLADLIIVFFVLLFTLWIFIPCILILWCTGEHYIWYQQKRVGFKNQRFNILKFATMLYNSPNMGTGSLTTRNDPRVLPFGKLLRKTKINELPQIFNVFAGSMSVVGPRPQMEIDFYRFPQEVQEHIYDSKPGITGIGSIVFRDEEYYLSNRILIRFVFMSIKLLLIKALLKFGIINNRVFGQISKSFF